MTSTRARRAKNKEAYQGNGIDRIRNQARSDSEAKEMGAFYEGGKCKSELGYRYGDYQAEL